MRRRLLIWLGLVATLSVLLLGWGYLNILADPVRRDVTVPLVDWPVGAPPLRVALLSDIHLQSPDMPPHRVQRIAGQVNAARPDLILIAGDLVGDRMLSFGEYDDAVIADAISAFRAPLGVVVVLGNHDHWRDGPALRAALEGRGIAVLGNQAARLGPITLAGIDDEHSGHADIAATRTAADALGGPVVALSHSPDVAPLLPPEWRVLLAGHTHCGQIVLPVIGAPAVPSRYGNRYRCGMVLEGGRTVLVTAGAGASVVPLRYGAPPDWLYITLGPQERP